MVQAECWEFLNIETEIDIGIGNITSSLQKGGGIVWVTASTKLCDLLITWSRDKCRALYLPFWSTYDHQNCHSGNLRWGNPTFKVTWRFDYVVMWQINKTYICTSTNLWLSNLVHWQLTIGRPYMLSQVTFWPRSHVTNVKP